VNETKNNGKSLTRCTNICMPSARVTRLIVRRIRERGAEKPLVMPRAEAAKAKE